MSIASVIGCCVGIVGCVVGVASFISAKLTKANQDGRMMEKLDQCCKGIDEIKKDMKDSSHETNCVLDEHNSRIVKLETQIINIYKQFNINRREDDGK